MSTVALNKEQESKLIGFIKDRGFHDPFVISELVNQFSPIVHEQLQNNPGLPVDEVMNKACTSIDAAMNEAKQRIGMPGYSSLASVYERQINDKYKKLFRSAWKDMLIKPLYLIVAVFVSVLFSAGYYWASGHLLVWEINGMVLFLFLLYLSSLFYLLFRFTIRKKPRSVVNNMVNSDYVFAFLLAFLMPSRGNQDHPTALLVYTFLYGMTFFYFITRSFAKYTVLKKAYLNNLPVYNCLDASR